MRIYSPSGAKVRVGTHTYIFKAQEPLEVLNEHGQYLLSTNRFFMEGETPPSPNENENKYYNIGVYRVGGLGDGFLASCIITSLKRLYPTSRIVAHSTSSVLKTWEGHPCIHHFNNDFIPKLNNNPAMRQGYDAFFDLMPDCFARYGDRIPQSIIGRYNRVRKELDHHKAIARFNHLQTYCEAKDLNCISVYNELFGTDATVKDMYLPQNNYDKFFFKRDNCPIKQKRYITIHDWAFHGRQTKSWYPQYWKALKEMLKRKYGLPLVQIGGRGEEYLHPDIDLRGITLGESIEVLKHSVLHLDNESTPAHIAPALGIPCVVLCGPTLKYWRHPENLNITSDHPCQECEGCGGGSWYNTCNLDNGSMNCMKKITPDLVMERITNHFKQGEGNEFIRKLSNESRRGINTRGNSSTRKGSRAQTQRKPEKTKILSN